ncbi:MAG TPA: DUF309 domain-containing protein [Candidatus Binatia bacterium]|nr:DUF309 domain-containing protein [Candidatus Binatia bacterium]
MAAPVRLLRARGTEPTSDADDERPDEAAPGPPRTGSNPAAPARILQGGRAKAYRPLSAEARRRAVRAGIAAYRRGDFFEAHELLEPAWLGSPDVVERDLLSGLIKLAAAYVHAVRGNPLGLLKNLRGARDRLVRGAGAAGAAVPIDVAALVPAIDARIHRLEGALAEGRPVPVSALRAPRLRSCPATPAGTGTSAATARRR